MSSTVLALQDIDRTSVALAGGKGANLGELARIEGIRVPDGFCIATAAFKRVLEATPSVGETLDRLALLKLEDRRQIAELSGELRKAIEGAAIPADVADEIARHLSRAGEDAAYAVRSSATAEDLPSASFAGQQDTYLNIVGKRAILEHVSKCWASLFTERAVTYRLQNDFDHRAAHLAVVVQKMVFPQAAGVLFTADPVTSNRKVISMDAGFGLGEALVSGLVNPDVYKVSGGKVIEKRIATKTLAVVAAQGGGTQVQEVEPDRQQRQVLADEQILQLARMGRQIEAHFGCPQDVEWCLADGAFYILQSRPITTLYPIPAANDRENHLYISVGHQQMMTDAMKPLGLSFFLLTTRAPMRPAGGRLFVDVTQLLASPAARKTFLDSLEKSEPLIKDALMTVIERGDLIETRPEDRQAAGPGRGTHAITAAGFRTRIDNDPAIVADLVQSSEAALAETKQAIQTQFGPELFDFIREDIQQLQKLMFDPRNLGVILAGMDASSWVNEKMEEWLGEKGAADTLSQSVPNNVTSAMGLALLDVADALRPHPQVVEYLEHAQDDDFLEQLARLDGGSEAQAAIQAFLDKYGMRCSGEIDITRPRWSEQPAALVPLILSNIRNFAPQAGKRKFEQGRQAALQKEQELIDRLRKLPGGEEKAEETRRTIAMIRNFAGYREYPKYAMVSRYFVYKQALLREAAPLVQAGVIRASEDIYYLTFDELHAAVRTGTLDDRIVVQRKAEHELHKRLTPPRVITSDGEIIAGRYRREDLPAGALAGLPVSSGVVEGRARVLLRMEEADLEAGDILVTPFTDPSWTPLFVSVKGLVTEVGGLMTHGAVIAREYGLPAVVGVENATRRIQDGQRIRVHGTEGYVEIL